MVFWKRLYRKFNGKGLWYPVQTLVGKPVDTQELAEELVYESTVSVADVHAVIRSLPRVIAKFMAEGRSVHLDGLGTFHYTILAGGKGVEKEEDVSAKQITGIRVHFIPEMKKQGTEITRALVGEITFMEWKGKDDKSTTKPGEGGNSGDGGTGGGGDDPGMWG